MKIPTILDFERQAHLLKDRIHKTPIHTWDTPLKAELLGLETHAVLKLELLQKTGSFKIRGALTVMDNLSEKEKQNGVVAGTGGNHGIAVAHAAKIAGVNAKIIVHKNINQYRLNAIKQLGCEIIQAENMPEVLDKMMIVARDENRTIMHPYENPYIPLGTGTLGYEICKQIPDLDVVIVPIGGGGLASGVATAVKQLNPNCKVYGVEPLGADSMYQSLKAGKPVTLKTKPTSIADSLCAPKSEPYSFSLCQKFLDDVVLVEDSMMKVAMDILFHDLKLAVEPAGAIATAGILGPLKQRCKGLKVGIIVCGSNIDLETFYQLTKDVRQ